MLFTDEGMNNIFQIRGVVPNSNKMKRTRPQRSELGLESIPSGSELGLKWVPSGLKRIQKGSETMSKSYRTSPLDAPIMECLSDGEKRNHEIYEPWKVRYPL